MIVITIAITPSLKASMRFVVTTGDSKRTAMKVMLTAKMNG